jgi:hypothetical protein
MKGSSNLTFSEIAFIRNLIVLHLLEDFFLLGYVPVEEE